VVTRPELWIARHGETDWSASGRHTGRTDLPLDEHGRDAARRLGEILAGEAFELVLTSPLSRARDTCRLAGFGAQAELDTDLHEWDYGEYEGLTTDEIRAERPGWTVFEDGCPGGESLAEVAARADRVIERARRVDGRVLAFGHGHSLRILAARWANLAAVEGSRLLLGTATVSVLGWERETATISRWNCA
jgi:probable phosphoglycerate mutase